MKLGKLIEIMESRERIKERIHNLQCDPRINGASEWAVAAREAIAIHRLVLADLEDIDV